MSNLFLKLKSRLNAAPSSTDMTQGEPWKLLTSFALPVLFSQIFQQLYNTADSLIVGRTLGMEALAAVSSSGNLIFLLVSFFMGMSTGAGVVIARYFGSGDRTRVRLAMHTNIVLAVTAGVLLSVIGVIATPALLELMDTDPDVLPEAIEYFRFYFMGGLAVVMYNFCTGTMNALGDSRRPLVYLICSSVINVLLDLLFVGVFRWGVWAAAFATTISQTVSVVLCLSNLFSRKDEFRLSVKELKFDGASLREIVRMGVPSGIQNSVIGLANVIVQSNINSFGKVATAGYGSYAKLEGFAFLPINSFTMAMTTFVGQNLGAGKTERAKKGSRFGITTAVIMSELVGIVFFITAPLLVELFSDDPDVIAAGVRQARIESLFYCLLSFSHAVAAVCRGAGKAFVPMAVMFSVWCILRVIYITVMMHFIHEIGLIFWAYPLTWGISSVIFAIYYRFCNWEGDKK